MVVGKPGTIPTVDTSAAAAEGLTARGTMRQKSVETSTGTLVMAFTLPSPSSGTWTRSWRGYGPLTGKSMGTSW